MADDQKGEGMGQVIQIDEARIRDHLGEMVRGTVEEALNAMLDAEADRLCGAGRYERNEARQDTRAGSYDRSLHTKAGEVMLSKIYLLKRCRGTGVGKEIMAFCEQRCRELGSKRLWLTVNKGNAGPIAFYERMGFENEGEMVTDIGGGYVMDDYKMVRHVRG